VQIRTPLVIPLISAPSTGSVRTSSEKSFQVPCWIVTGSQSGDSTACFMSCSFWKVLSCGCKINVTLWRYHMLILDSAFLNTMCLLYAADRLPRVCRHMLLITKWPHFHISTCLWEILTIGQDPTMQGEPGPLRQILRSDRSRREEHFLSSNPYLPMRRYELATSKRR
jgi:hypothetical protein